MTIDRQLVLAILVLLGAVAVVLLINPVGYIGGPRDDGRYLEAARCWVAHGACLPTNHWEGRWLVFAPLAFLIRLFGESRAVVQIWPFVGGVVALLLFARVAHRLFETRTSLTAGLLLAFTPVFAVQLLRPNAETIELSLILAAVICILRWRERPAEIWAFAAGLFFGLAFQVRETSIVAAVIAAGAMFAIGPRPSLFHIAFAALGFALPLVIEFAVFEYATGDFLYRRRLSLFHVRIPSSELPSSVDRANSPLLNPDYIANWRREMGFHVHWIIDGPLNLLFNAKSGFALLLAPFLLVARQKSIDCSRRRAAWRLLGLAAIYVAIVTYFFAIDPKPRVMLIPLALGSLALALILIDLFSNGRKALAIAISAVVVVSGISIIASSVRMTWAERQAKDWIVRYPHAIETNKMTSLMLTLNADARALPDFRADRPYAMVMSNIGCHEWMKRSQLDPGVLSVAGEKRLTILPDADGSMTSLCLFRYHRTVSGERMKEALDNAWGNSEIIAERQLGH